MEARHFKILNYLNRNGVAVEMDISPVLRELYPGVDRMDSKRVIQESGNIDRLLRSMQREGLLNFQKYSIGADSQSGYVNWIDTTAIQSSITNKGKSILDEEIARRLNKQPTNYKPVIEPNPVLRDPIKSGRNKQILSIVLSGVSFLFLSLQVIEAIFEKPKPVIQRRIETTPEQIEEIRSYYKKVGNSIRRAKADSLLKKNPPAGNP